MSMFWDDKTKTYRTPRYTIGSEDDYYGDKTFYIVDEWAKSRHSDGFQTRAEATKEAKRLEKINGALRPVDK